MKGILLLIHHKPKNQVWFITQSTQDTIISFLLEFQRIRKVENMCLQCFGLRGSLEIVWWVLDKVKQVRKGDGDASLIVLSVRKHFKYHAWDVDVFWVSRWWKRLLLMSMVCGKRFILLKFGFGWCVNRGLLG